MDFSLDKSSPKTRIDFKKWTQSLHLFKKRIISCTDVLVFFSFCSRLSFFENGVNTLDGRFVCLELHLFSGKMFFCSKSWLFCFSRCCSVLDQVYLRWCLFKLDQERSSFRDCHYHKPSQIMTRSRYSWRCVLERFSKILCQPNNGFRYLCQPDLKEGAKG